MGTGEVGSSPQRTSQALEADRRLIRPSTVLSTKVHKIRRVIRGIYYYPQSSKILGQELTPDIHHIAQALARKFAWRIQPSGAMAQNLLGLSTQIPARAIYLSDGPDRSYDMGKTTLICEHTALKEMGFKHRESGLIVQALKSLGQNRITPEILAKIRRWLDPGLRQKVLADTKTATGWVYIAIQEITREGFSPDKVANLPAAQRRDLFREAGSRRGMSPGVIEKDFWVCWVLKKLFTDPELKKQMVFKGGTSLSKVYGLTEKPHQ